MALTNRLVVEMLTHLALHLIVHSNDEEQLVIKHVLAHEAITPDNEKTLATCQALTKAEVLEERDGKYKFTRFGEAQVRRFYHAKSQNAA